MAKYAWLECPHCGGVFVRLADPDFDPVGKIIRAADYLHRDGTPVVNGELADCDDCGYAGGAFRGGNLRHGDVLPERKGM